MGYDLGSLEAVGPRQAAVLPAVDETLATQRSVLDGITLVAVDDPVT